MTSLVIGFRLSCLRRDYGSVEEKSYLLSVFSAVKSLWILLEHTSNMYKDLRPSLFPGIFKLGLSLSFSL
jgi:hypothetical protein